MRRFTIYNIFIVLLIAMLTGCDLANFGDKNNDDDNTIPASYKLTLSDVKFDDKYRDFTIDINSNYDIYDSTKLEVVELHDNDTIPSKISARIIAVANNRIQEVAAKHGDVVLVIVDMTLSDAQIAQQKSAIMRLRKAFPDGQLNVSFMWGNYISKSVHVTDYILNNHFVSHPSTKYLLRSILAKIDEMSGRDPRYFKEVSRNDMWSDIPIKYRRIIVFSDGETYRDNKPIDPLHFQLQRELSELTDSSKLPSVDYVNFGASTTADERDLSLSLIVDRCNGTYYDIFALNSLLSEVIEEKEMIPSDIIMTLRNPDGRIFTGRKHKVIINYHRNDSTTYSGSIDLDIGSIYSPIVSGGSTTWQVIAKGFFNLLLLFCVLYVVLQILFPYVNYQLFKRRYQSRYNGPGSITKGIIANPTCYYCKSDFVIGDEIVAKCKHTMHKSCWIENGYKCPEYGSRCPDGSHYYNTKNLLDKANAPIYLKWIVGGIVTAFLAWWFSTLFSATYNDLEISFFHFSQEWFDDDHITIANELVISEFFIIMLTLFTSLYISTYLSRGNWLRRRLPTIIIKVVLCCIISYIACSISVLIYVALSVKNTSLFVDWVPWVLSGVSMLLILSYNSHIDHKRAIKWTLITVALVVISLYMWRFTDFTFIDIRLSQLLTCLIYSVGFGITLATQTPPSQRYFMRVSGAIKEMDIALFKWFNSGNNRGSVIVGKAIDCDICMSWDLSSSIAPQQLKIILRNGGIYIIPMDYGVKRKGRGKELKINIAKRLYHGESFMVGRTQFTYIEMDN